VVTARLVRRNERKRGKEELGRWYEENEENLCLVAGDELFDFRLIFEDIEKGID
jgi:hypothetical protein